MSTATARAAVEQLVAAWNEGRLGRVLGPAFCDRDRLAASMEVRVPRDARLRLLAVEGVQTLEQGEEVRGGRRYRVSLIAVVARTQLEYEDPTRGLQRLEGRNEYLLRVREPLP